MIGGAGGHPARAMEDAVPRQVMEAVEEEGLDGMEIDAEDKDQHPTPIAVWSELCEQDGSVGIDADLMHKIRICKNTDDHGDVSRRIPGIECYFCMDL